MLVVGIGWIDTVDVCEFVEILVVKDDVIAFTAVVGLVVVGDCVEDADVDCILFTLVLVTIVALTPSELAFVVTAALLVLAVVTGVSPKVNIVQ